MELGTVLISTTSVIRENDHELYSVTSAEATKYLERLMLASGENRHMYQNSESQEAALEWFARGGILGSQELARIAAAAEAAANPPPVVESVVDPEVALEGVVIDEAPVRRKSRR